MTPAPPTPAPRAGAARIFLDGTPVTARVSHRDASGMTLRQELPFLQLERAVRDEEGRRASLASVGVTVRDGTPSLVLELRYDERGDEATLAFPTDRPQRARREETQPYAPESAYAEEDAVIVGGAPATPLTPLSVPVPARRPWHAVLWARVRALFARR